MLLNILAMSDLHLSRKPWQVRKALKQARHAELLLLAGDLTNDGTPAQFTLLAQCIAELLPDTPVLAVAGNHDFPAAPIPEVQWGICNAMLLQEWLLRRQPYPYQLDASGAYWLRIGDTEVIGLNCVSHWREFQFGGQLAWLEDHLHRSDAHRHVMLCHAPLRLHSPAGNAAPYLRQDKEIQRMLDKRGHCIFLSGHTHISMESPVMCVEHDKERQNLYINAGSIRPTVLLDSAGRHHGATAQGNAVELVLKERECTVRVIGLRDAPTLRTYQIQGL